MIPPADPARSSGAPGATVDAGAERRLPYDRAFHEAVEAGLLNAQQAAQRGNRAAMGQRLSRTYGIPLELALEVADNRLSLPDALVRAKSSSAHRTPAAQIVVPGVPPARRRVGAIWIPVVAVLLAAAGFFAVRGDAGKLHYVEARDTVRDYELGKPASTINYAHPIFERALGQLALVPESSNYAAPAEQLRVEIQDKIDAYRQRLESSRAAAQKKVQRRQERRQVLTEASRADRLQANRTFPECEEAGAHEP